MVKDMRIKLTSGGVGRGGVNGKGVYRLLGMLYANEIYVQPSRLLVCVVGNYCSHAAS